MHLKKLTLRPQDYPVKDIYPFNLDVFKMSPALEFDTKITFFCGENGSGKSTLLKAVTKRCGIYIWKEYGKTRFDYNPYEDELYRYIDIEWADGKKPGAYFSAESYEHLATIIDDWASCDPDLLDYFGGKSLITQSHGESFMSFFKSRYRIEGVYFLDEPETALSPKRQIEFLRLLTLMSADGHAQFVIATHSPILLSCPGAKIISFDGEKLEPIHYEETDYYRIYRDFLLDREKYLKDLDG
ncbi:MAG TPA: AAA family ATPase [Desulfomonilia bacterium]